MAIEFTGEHGVIRYGYHTVAGVRGWRIAREDKEGPLRLTGTAEDVNDFWLTEQPLKFVVTRERGISRWPVVGLEISGVSLTAVLGPREVVT